MVEKTKSPARTHGTSIRTPTSGRSESPYRDPAKVAAFSAATELPSPSRSSSNIVQTAAVRENVPYEEETEDQAPPGGLRRSQRAARGSLQTPSSPSSGGASLSQRLRLPAALPGADAPPIVLPPLDARNPESRARAIDQLFPQLPAITGKIEPEAVPGEAPWRLEQLEDYAASHNPLLVQATADIDAAEGTTLQAGMYPNPTIGYEADTVGSNKTLNYQGGFIEQTLKTAGKLELARMSAQFDTMNAQLALRKTRVDLLAKVRANYYAVLVAQDSVRAGTALVQFTNEVYQIEVEQLQGGQAAAYEPMQLRALAVQARGTLRQAQNRYTAAWRQLAASLGSPDLKPRPLAGRADVDIPEIHYEAALGYVLEHHTDVLTAHNKECQARVNLRRAEVTPIPDINVYAALQRDFTTPPVLRWTYNLQVGVPVPVFDRNRGGIQNAHALLVRASEEAARARNDLTAQLADAYERYATNRTLAENYRQQILPDQARAYRGVYERHQQEPDQLGFGEIVVAQQNLLASITAYLQSLTTTWTAVTEIQALLQFDAQDGSEAVEESPAPSHSAETIRRES